MDKVRFNAYVTIRVKIPISGNDPKDAAETIHNLINNQETITGTVISPFSRIMDIYSWETGKHLGSYTMDDLGK